MKPISEWIDWRALLKTGLFWMLVFFWGLCMNVAYECGRFHEHSKCYDWRNESARKAFFETNSVPKIHRS